MKSNNLFSMIVLSLSLGFSTLLATTEAVYANVPTTLIQPSDGTWKATIASNEVKGCPIMMKKMLSKNSLPSKSKAIVFQKPFDPSTLFDGAKDLKWENIGINQWKAVMIQAQGAVNMHITWKLGINSEKKIAIDSLLSVDIPKELMVMLGTSGQCTVHTLGDFNLIK